MPKPEPAYTADSETSLHQSSDAVFARAAEIFRLMSTPIRIRIISTLCHGEKNVSEILANIATTQPNLSQHLNLLYQARVLDKERRGNQIFYRIGNHDVVALCSTLCNQVAADQQQANAGEQGACL